MVWFIIPESLSLRRMELLRQKYLAEADGRRDHGLVRRAFAFLSPLCLLMPETRGEEVNSNPLKMKGHDWALTLVAVAYGCTLMTNVGVFVHCLFWIELVGR